MMMDGDTPINGYSIVRLDGDCSLESNPHIDSVTCLHYLHPVSDTLLPGYPDALPAGFTYPNVPVASDSIFSQYLGNGGTLIVPATAISIQELDAIGNPPYRARLHTRQ